MSMFLPFAEALAVAQSLRLASSYEWKALCKSGMRPSNLPAAPDKVKAAGLPTDRDTCWRWYISQVRKNLHVVLCFSPVGDDFRSRARKFPALVNCTVIDWFQPWPVSGSVVLLFCCSVVLFCPVVLMFRELELIDYDLYNLSISSQNN